MKGLFKNKITVVLSAALPKAKTGASVANILHI